MEAKLYVGNLSYDTTEQTLRELFGQAGSVVSVAVIKEPGTTRSKGFAFIEMVSQGNAQKAISMFNGYNLNDRPLTVNMARPRRTRWVSPAEQQPRQRPSALLGESMKFKNGEYVVHPQHGVGQVVALSEREFTPGTKQPYYEIAIAGGSVWVPVDLSISGLRGLAVKSEITHCRQVLEASPSPLSEDARYRRAEQAARLKAGDASSPVRGGARPVCLWRAQIHEWHHRVVLPGGARRALPGVGIRGGHHAHTSRPGDRPPARKKQGNLEEVQSPGWRLADG